jgi:hypothetical protein
MEIDTHPNHLETRLSAARLAFLPGDAIRLVFSVANPGGDAGRFCRYMTPFEGFNGNIMKVTDLEGNPVPYIGVLKKRSRPKPADHLHLASHTQVEVEFDLGKAYSIGGPGTYSIQFKGHPSLNKLPDSNVLEITVPA